MKHDEQQSPPPEGNDISTGIRLAVRDMILSASGWRKVFAPSGDEEDPSGRITRADCALVALAALVFSDFITGKGERPVCAVGTDTRPTGPAIASIVCRVLSARGIVVHYLSALPAPQIMAYTGHTEEVTSFAYISASHNPVGHNGFKFGLSDGGVLDGTRAAVLIDAFRKACNEPGKIGEALSLAGTADGHIPDRINSGTKARQEASVEAYLRLTREIVSGSPDPSSQKRFFASLRESPRKTAVVVDFNGSARALSIDRDILSEAGVPLHCIHEVPGRIAHRIVPEGESLDPCKRELERLHAADPRYLFGYVPDNDGDRGNLVYMDTVTDRAEAVEAQDVFALAVLAELAYHRWRDNENDREAKTAVAVNGPTSRRIERIAGLLDARVFRCEVGEANVVGLADIKRKEGYRVPILGEGSNGGNITHPSQVRDPIDTVFSLLKLLLLEEDLGLFGKWCELAGKPHLRGATPAIGDILATLPAYTTTSAFEDEAKIRVSVGDHAALKAAWEEIFLRDWEKRKDRLRDAWGITSWEEVNYEGTGTRPGFGPHFRSGSEKGGLAVLLKDQAGDVRAFLWMRGSGTEPVFRILVDVEGGKDFHDELLAWHRDMVLEANGRAG